MNKIFDLDSPVMQFLSKMADLVWLNLLTIICCIPIITAGAALTALHYSVLKMVKNEDGYLTRSYFKSFKQNFRQATVIWLILLVFAGIAATDIYIIRQAQDQIPKAAGILMGTVGLFVIMISVYVFPVLARFENTIWNTIKNAALFSMITLPQTMIMVLLYCLPVLLVFFVRLFPLVVLFGFSVPAYLSAMMYARTFKRFEPEETEGIVQEETEVNEEEEITEQ